MKKSLLLLLSLTSAIMIYGCTKAPAENEPVVVADNVTESTITPSAAATDNTFTADSSDISDSGNTSADSNTPVNTDQIMNTSEKASPLDTEITDTKPQTEAETKKLTLSIEGTQEEYTGSVYHSKLGYQIIYDIDRFSPSMTEDGADYFIADNSDPELYPYTFVRISRNTKPVSDSATDSNDPTFAKYDIYSNITGYVATEFSSDVKVGGYDAKLYHFTSGKDWNSTTNDIYLIEHGDYTYEIMTQTFLEASEGYGARIQAMLDTFTFE